MSASGYKDTLSYVAVRKRTAIRGYLISFGSIFGVAAVSYVWARFQGRSSFDDLPFWEQVPWLAGAAIVAVGILIYTGRGSTTLICPYCEVKFNENNVWKCSECAEENKFSVLYKCLSCSHFVHALLCPFCSRTIILKQEALKWTADFVDKHTSKFLVSAMPPPAQPPPPPRKPQPEPEPVDPVILMMDEYSNSTLSRHDFLEKKREEMIKKHGQPLPQFVQDMLVKMENMIYKEEEAGSRGRR